jgi:hypothetical protein
MNTRPEFDRIALLAYQIWESEGRPEGRAEDNWREAERRLRDEIPQSVADNAAELQGDVAKLDGDFSPQPYERASAQRNGSQGRRTGRAQSAGRTSRSSHHAQSR